MKKLLIFVMMVVPLYGQTLDQQLRHAQSAGVIDPMRVSRRTEHLNTFSFGGIAPSGISSLFSPQGSVEESRIGNLTVYYPKGYGEVVLHSGVWNAIPFVVFDDAALEVRFGLLFEHRQLGFVPDDWVSTAVSRDGYPELHFLIPDSKTFLNFTHGSAQWRATVLLTDAQIVQLLEFGQNDGGENLLMVTHRFIDGTSRSYYVGARHKAMFKILGDVYKQISNLPDIRKYRSGNNAFPTGSFFDSLSVETMTEDIIDIEETYTEGEYYYEDGGYEDGGYEYGDEYGYE